MSVAENEVIVKAFYEQAFNDGQPGEARAKYLTETYTQQIPWLKRPRSLRWVRALATWPVPRAPP